RLRTVMLTRETLNKQGYTVKVRIGQPILPEDVEGMDIGPLGRYLRSRSYALQSQCLSADSRVSHEWPSPVAEKVDPAVVRGEIDSLSSDKLLMEDGNYRLYLLHTVDAPNVMRDLYRLREETFRAVGEGTGKPFDTDKYDDYYYQLILWNVPAGEIAGAYRLGDCGAIIDKYGVEGIYSASLYRYKAAAEPVLRKCIELGRSFVARKYQREIHPLRLLLAGIAAATLHIPSAEYFLGPVSISNDYPVFFKSLATRFLERDFPLADAASLVEPTHPFVPDYMAVNPDDLLKVVPEGDIVKFDRLFSTISDGKYHLPVLVRQYFSCSARLACLNVDPDFTDSLDGLILLRLSEFPKAKTRSILRGAPEELREAINTHFFGND
ncbi:MAG: lysophospholipid acyltransferase family protein, partial [Bacteroidales bacterium]|nr:lysophospholipid acyltransferase family protein [Bacteroidales bacterium]